MLCGRRGVDLATTRPLTTLLGQEAIGVAVTTAVDKLLTSSRLGVEVIPRLSCLTFTRLARELADFWKKAKLIRYVATTSN